MNRSTRLKKSGINTSFGENTVPLSTLISVIDFNTTQADLPGNHSSMENRLVSFAKYLGLPNGLPGYMIASWPVSKEIDILGAFKRAVLENESNLMAVVRQLKLEELRGTYRHMLASTTRDTAYEGMVALSAIGIEERDYNGFVSQVFHDNEHIGYAAYGFLAEAGMHEKLLNSNNKITEKIDNDDVFAAMVEFSTTGQVDLLDTFVHVDDWQKKVALGYYLAGQMKTKASVPAVTYILQMIQNERDSDALASLSWALGQAVKGTGVDGAAQVLEFCRDNLMDNDIVCFALNGAYRYTPTVDELPEVLAILDECVSDDSDRQRAVARVREAWTQSYTAGSWFFTDGYGRGIHFYDRDAFAPAELKNIVLPHHGSNDSILNTIAYFSKFSGPAEMLSCMASSFLHGHPEAIGLLTKMLEEKTDNNFQKGLATALLLAEVEHSTSPLYLRCCLGADVGGPIPEEPGLLGEMIAYYDEYRLKEAVVGLMRLGSEQLRAEAASYLNTRLMFHDNDDYRQNLFKIGVIADNKKSFAANTTPVMWMLSAGFKFDQGTLEAQVEQAGDEDLAKLSQQVCACMSQMDERAVLMAMARSEGMWGRLDLVPVQELVKSMIFKSSWVPKESGCILAATVGERVLEGDLGLEIGQKLLKLVNDDDSDVEREAKRACAILNLEFVEVTPEILRQRLIHGTENFDFWVGKLWEFMAEGDRRETQGLARLNPLWTNLDPEEVATKWLELSHSSGWVQRETMAILMATSGALLLSTSQVDDVRNRIVEMTGDNDSDVEREAKLACDSHAITY